MNKNDVLKLIETKKLIPVVKLDRVEDAVPLAKALIDGGLPIAEVTFRTAVAQESIKAIMEAYPEMLVGAGTVTNLEQARQAIALGVKFIVSPGLDDQVIELAKENDVLVFPGVCTPTEIMRAMNHGLDIVKFFPANQFGGLKTIKALSGPFPKLRFMPTGGVNAENINDYLAFAPIIGCGGSWMVDEKLLNSGDFKEVTRITAEALEIITDK